MVLAAVITLAILPGSLCSSLSPTTDLWTCCSLSLSDMTTPTPPSPHSSPTRSNTPLGLGSNVTSSDTLSLTPKTVLLPLLHNHMAFLHSTDHSCNWTFICRFSGLLSVTLIGPEFPEMRGVIYNLCFYIPAPAVVPGSDRKSMSTRMKE